MDPFKAAEGWISLDRSGKAHTYLPFTDFEGCGIDCRSKDANQEFT